MSHKRLLWLGIWCLLLIAAFACDMEVKRWLFGHQFHDAAAGIMKGTWWAGAAKAFGTLYLTIPVLVILVAFAGLAWPRALIGLLCSISGGIADLVKPMFGRPRPVIDGELTGWMEFHPFHAHVATAFPSSHTMVAFATAAFLAWYYPKWRWLWFGLAAVVGAERVLEVAHHVSDAVAAAGMGIIAALLWIRFLEPWARKFDPAVPCEPIDGKTAHE